MAVAAEAMDEAAIPAAKPGKKPSRARQAKDQAKPEEQPQQVEVAMAAEKKDPKPKASKNTSIHHPPYIQMVVEAISFLKERTGSSQHAIAKYLEDKYSTGLPASFKRMLSIQLKSLSNSKKITKIKNSFKLPAVSKSSSKSKPASAAASKPRIKVPKSSISPAKKPAAKAAATSKPSKRVMKPAKPSSRALRGGLPSPKLRELRASTRSSTRSKKATPAKRKISTPSKPKKAVTPAKRARRAVAK